VIINFALIPSQVLDKPWTMVTSMFLHGGVWHLFMNMLALYFFGMYIERIISEKKLVGLYFIGGIAGSLLYILLAYISPLTPLNSVVVGASGALFAVGGALAVLRPHIRVIIFPIPIPMPLWQAEIIIFLIVSFLPNVAWEGHLGGLIAGVLFGYYYKKKQRHGETIYFATRYY
jgi:membrane associated rhomboid family serine protease